MKSKRISAKIIRELNMPKSLAYKSPNPFIRRIFWQRFDVLLKLSNIKKTDKVADVGCGSGLFLPTLSKFSSEVYAFDKDINKSTYELLKMFKIRNVKLIKKDIRKSFKLKNYFDVVICADVLEHIDNVEGVIGNISNIMKNNGKLLVSNPSDSIIYKFLSYFTGFKKSSLKEKHITNTKDIEKLLKKHFLLKEKVYVPNKLLSLFNILFFEKNSKKVNK